MIAAESAVRAWVNGKADLVGEGNPLATGAFLRSVRSPAAGAYCMIARTGGASAFVAEQSPDLATAHLTFLVYSATVEVAELAAAALATEIEGLTGTPQVADPDDGVWLLLAENLTGPITVPQPADSGELYCFQVAADFMLAVYT